MRRERAAISETKVLNCCSATSTWHVGQEESPDFGTFLILNCAGTRHSHGVSKSTLGAVILTVASGHGGVAVKGQKALRAGMMLEECRIHVSREICQG